MRVSELNFSEIKQNLKEYIANNTDFTDYNFEGSGFNILFDILAYNTYYNAFFLNMAINENFIGTAIKRGSLASLAKNFGYIPKGYTSSRMKIFIEISEPNPLKANGYVINIDKTATFTVNGANKTYTFTPIKTYTFTSANGKYSGEIELIEGVRIKQTFISPFSKLIIPNFNIDLDTLEVYEITAENETIQYEKFSNLKTIDGTSNIYYIFETPFQEYEIYFGDGVLGTIPKNTSTIEVYYKTSDGAAANALDNVQYDGSAIDGRFVNNDIVFSTIVPSYGGSDPESLDNIRKNILTAYYAQERAVTINDYKFFLEREYPLAQSISVWGGQDNDPPIYGKVFISIKPKTGFSLSNIEKESIISLLKTRNVVTVIPEIVDPEYTFLMIDSSVKYDSRKTTIPADNMKINIINKIQEFNDNELTKFDTYFNYSKFITMINNIDSSIIGNITTILLKKYIPFLPNITTTYNINFKNAIKQRTFKNITPLKMETDPNINTTLDIFLEDDGDGNVYAYSISSSGEKNKIKQIGTINYTTGQALLYMNVSNIVGTETKMIFTVEPKEFDVQMKYNDILTIDVTDLTVKVIAI